jgi:hypothetical protein
MAHTKNKFGKFTVTLVCGWLISTQPGLAVVHAGTVSRVPTRPACAQQTLRDELLPAWPGGNGGSGAISGLVTRTDTGQGVSGVRVDLRGCYLFDYLGPLLYTVTGSNGSYSFTGLTAGEYQLNWYPDPSAGVSLQDYYITGETTRTIHVVEPQVTVADISLNLTQGGRMMGWVNAQDFDPISFVRVVLNGPGNVSRSAMTSFTGDYTVYAIPSGVYTVSLYTNYAGSPPGYAPVVNARIVTVTAPQQINADFMLAPGGAMTGTVAVSGTGQSPLESLQVFAKGGPDSTTVLGSYSFGSGGFSFYGLAPGAYHVYVEPGARSRYIRAYYDNTGIAGTDDVVTVTAQSTTGNINIALALGGQVSGTVRDGQGNPLRFIAVQLIDLQGSVVASTTTDANGGYVTGPGVQDGSYRVRFSNAVYEYCTRPLATVYAPQLYLGGTPVQVITGAVTPGIDAVMQPLPPKAFLPVVWR